MGIEAGTYKGRAVAGSEQYGQTSNNNDQIVIDLDLFEIGQRVSTFLVFSDKAAPWSMKRLRACGWTGDNLADLTGIDSNEVDVEVAYEEYKGEQKMKVQIIAGGTVTLEKQFDDKGKRAFAAKFADLAKATAGPKAPNYAPKRTVADDTTAIGNDDIPF